MDGLLVVDKPVGPTSHDVVARVRRLLGVSRVGHTGTLDPAASGVLPLVIGRATRLARFLSAADKTYDVTIRLGVQTDSHDSTGRPIGPIRDVVLKREEVDVALDGFRGEFLQQPPAYSAKKIQGKRSHRLARQSASRNEGAEILGSPSLAAPSPVTVRRLEVIELDGSRLVLQLECSAGFYVRSLAHELGIKLETGAHVETLRRTRSGDLSVDAATPLALLEESLSTARSAIIPLAKMLPSLGLLELTADGVVHARQGRLLGAGDAVSGSILPAVASQPASGGGKPYVRLVDPAGDLVGLAQPAGPGLLHPFVILM